ncbi:MAG: replication protein A, partial [Candidatus Methanogasteraceae archaeon]
LSGCLRMNLHNVRGNIMIDETSEQIQKRFLELNVDIELTEIKRRLSDLTERFKVPIAEAGRSVVSYFLREHGITREAYYGTPQGAASSTQISDINQSEQWINLHAKVVQLWDSTSPAIDQVGLIGDETGTIKFVKWTKSNLPELVEGKSYSLDNMTTDEWEGRFSVKMNRTTRIQELDEDIEIPDQEAQLITIDSINESNKWVNLRAKVVELWDSEHESIDQVGLVGDETGTIKFVKWAKSELPALLEGKSYSFENLTTDEFEERFSVKFNKNSSIKELDEDIEVGFSTTEFTGAMVHIQDGSGLIRRCPMCNRALMKGTCMEHGNVDGIHDLRIKAVLDNGIMVQEALFNREITESISGITLDEAKEMAVDALDQSVVQDEMKKRLLCRYYTMSGSILDRYMLVENVWLVEGMPDNGVDALLAEVT